MELRKASRQKTKMRIALAGPSGSGKTYSALLMASGMTSWEKIALIDTENGSGELYAHLGPYNVLTLAAPFTPERYVQAIKKCEQAGADVIIIDSISHEWDGVGGILEIKDSMTGNSFTNWNQINPRHNAFVQAMLASSAHVIATMRTKQDYVLVQNDKGKQVPQKIGLKAITREGVDYEFTLVFDLNIEHLATASKDRTSLFMNPTETSVPTKIGEDTGKRLLEWAAQGDTPPAEALTVEKPRKKATVAQVCQWLNACKREQQLETMYDQACKHDWNDEDAKVIRACYESAKKKLTASVPAVAA